jgi:transcriptional regulator with XRE-family HTH domain
MTENPEQKERRIAFGQAIADFRKQYDVSQEKLALAAQIDRSYMGRIERGEQSVSIDKIWSIADVLGIPPSKLFARVQNHMRHQVERDGKKSSSANKSNRRAKKNTPDLFPSNKVEFL